MVFLRREEITKTYIVPQLPCFSDNVSEVRKCNKAFLLYELSCEASLPTSNIKYMYVVKKPNPFQSICRSKGCRLEFLLHHFQYYTSYTHICIASALKLLPLLHHIFSFVSASVLKLLRFAFCTRRLASAAVHALQCSFRITA